MCFQDLTKQTLSSFFNNTSSMSMDLMSMNIHVSQSMSQTISPPSPSHLHSSHNGFPIIVIAIIGILATAFLLLSYYIFVIKCCLNWQRIDILGRFSLSRSRRREDLLMGYTTTFENRGLDESVIRSIPIFQFKKVEKEDPERGNSFVECAVCLSEFHEQEKLRMIPNCGHLFHIDCIDVWLQNNANCPLCRTSISLALQFPLLDQERPSSSHQDHQVQYHDNFIGREEDYVVIELGEQENNPAVAIQETKPPSPSQKKLGSKMVKKRSKKDGLRHTSMGDECIDTSVKDERLVVQPIRRSFSMDSAADRQLYLAVQQIVNQKSTGPNVSEPESVSCEGCCSSKIRRSIFSFGHGRASRRREGLPIQLEQ